MSERTRNKFAEQKRRIDNTNRKHVNIQWNLLKTKTEIQVKLCKHFRLFVKLERNKERKQIAKKERIGFWKTDLKSSVCVCEFRCTIYVCYCSFYVVLNCVCALENVQKTCDPLECVLLNNKNKQLWQTWCATKPIDRSNYHSAEPNEPHKPNEQIIWASKINRNLFTMWHVQYWWFEEFIRFEHTFL